MKFQDLHAILTSDKNRGTEKMVSMSCDYPDSANHISRRCHHCGGSYCVRHITLEAYGQNICDLCAEQRSKQVTKNRQVLGWVVL